LNGRARKQDRKQAVANRRQPNDGPLSCREVSASKQRKYGGADILRVFNVWRSPCRDYKQRTC